MTTWRNVSKKKYKNGIAKLGRQHYEVLVTRSDPRNKRGRVSRRRIVHGPRHKAEAVKRQLEAELDAQLASQTSPETTLSDFARQWLEVRSAALKPSTREKYVNDLGKHILPALGHMRLRDLRPSDIAEFLARDPGAANSKKNRLAVLRVLAKDAIADGLVDRDFCLRVSVKVPDVYSEEEPNLLSGEQCGQVLLEIPRYWQDVACTLGLTGLRWGEVSAFHWRDIDFDRQVVAVRWTNWKGTLVEPKTTRSRRTIPLVESLCLLLRERHERMKAERHPGLRRGLVFPTQTGGLHKGTPFNPVLRAACKRAGITIRLTPHGLRRTWNDLARRVADGLVVRSLLGHASEAMTDHYSMVDHSEKRRTAETVAGHLLPPAAEVVEAEIEAEVQRGEAEAETTTAGQGEERLVDAGQPSGPARPAHVDEMVDAGGVAPASDCPNSQ